MSNYWLIIDVSNMAYRAFATLGTLRHEGAATGVVYGVAKQLEAMCEDYDTRHIVACFDGGSRVRDALLPGYKASRKEKREQATDEEKQGRAELVAQLADLRTKHLPAVGVANVLHVPGFEADDIIAGVVHAVPTEDAAVIWSADEDLWQCIRPGVSWYSPTTKQKMSYKRFTETHNMEPFLWANVKAWAGCKTDDVPGLDGIGETWAARWVRGEIKANTPKAAQFAAGLEIFNRNIRLTKLPAAGFPPVVLQPVQGGLQWGRLYQAIGAKHDAKAAGIKGGGFGL